MLRIEDTEDDVDFRPRSPADDLRYDECGVKVCGLRLARFAARMLAPLPVEDAVLILGLAGTVDLV